MNSLSEYIKRNTITQKRLESEIRDERNAKLPTRNIFVLLRKYAKDFFSSGSQPRMLALSGLRGVGKTTLMWQTAEYVYSSNLTKTIIFINVDDLNRLEAGLFDVINILENQIFNCSLNEMDDRIMLLIDEVHESSQWQKDLKILYERGKKIFVIATGSSALLLHTSSDLASRWSLLKVFPFSFPEYILSKSWLINQKELLFPIDGLSDRLKDILFYSLNYDDFKTGIKNIEKKCNDYLIKSTAISKTNQNQFIDEYVSYYNIARFLPIINTALINDRILALFDRILLKDIPDINPSLLKSVINRLLFRLALSDEINYQSLSSDFSVKENDIEQIISTLNDAEILNVFLPHGGVKSKTGKSKKVFFMSPSLRHALYSRIYGDKLNNDLKAKLYEDIVAMYLKRNLSDGVVSFGFGQKKNPDFVVETMDSNILIEVGINKSDKNQIKKYKKYRYGIILNSKITEPDFDDTNKILFIPLSWFLLL